ncbi:MAG: response regulator transcription factor [Gammaproteobacteria bacterium]|nr:response regulator transcription factor [Gammaproteobacteria bacterium]
MNVVLVEDDFDVARNICEYLETSGCAVEWAPDGLIGLERITAGNCDLLLLDISLPRLSGIELCHRVRQLGKADLPIIMITARGELPDKLNAFDVGADDYIVKPFALEELERRIRALTRRTARQSHENLLRVEDLEFDVATHTVRRRGLTLPITSTGRQLLELLMRNSHRVVRREELEQQVWGDDVPSSDVLKIHIHTLREAIDKPFDRPLISTVRGVGYRIHDNNDAA